MRVTLAIDGHGTRCEALTVQAEGCLHATKLERPSVPKKHRSLDHIRQKRPVAFSIRGLGKGQSERPTRRGSAHQGSHLVLALELQTGVGSIFRRCPPHVRFTPLDGRMPRQVSTSALGRKRTSEARPFVEDLSFTPGLASCGSTRNFSPQLCVRPRMPFLRSSGLGLRFYLRSYARLLKPSLRPSG